MNSDVKKGTLRNLNLWKDNEIADETFKEESFIFSAQLDNRGRRYILITGKECSTPLPSCALESECQRITV